MEAQESLIRPFNMVSSSPYQLAEQYRQFQSSFFRCTQHPQFSITLYQLFLQHYAGARCPLFTHQNPLRQQRALEMATLQLLKPTFNPNSPGQVIQLARILFDLGIVLDEHDAAIWLECLQLTVRRLDRCCNDLVVAAWARSFQNSMGLVWQYMADRTAQSLAANQAYMPKII